MKFHLSFDGESLRSQNPENVVNAKKLVSKLQTLIGMKINLKVRRSVRNKDKDHFIVDCDGVLKNLLNAIDCKVTKIKSLGIDEVVLWCLYEYEAQCNMEFTPEEILIMGRNNIGLCISCWKRKRMKI